MAVTPNSKFAYVANFFDGTVSGYSVDPKTGVLTQVPASPPTGSMPRSVAVDITGQFVYVTNSGSNNVSRLYDRLRWIPNPAIRFAIPSRPRRRCHRHYQIKVADA